MILEWPPTLPIPTLQLLSVVSGMTSYSPHAGFVVVDMLQLQHGAKEHPLQVGFQLVVLDFVIFVPPLLATPWW